MAEKKATQSALGEDPIIKLTEVILIEGVRRKASDILIEPLEKNMRVRYRVDGFLQHGFEFPRSFLSSLLVRIKVVSKLNISERRLPQDGRFKLRVGDKLVDFRVAVVPSIFGEKVTLRILDKANLVLELSKLGFTEESGHRLQEAARRPHGMLLICGPTGCGKTTTLYSLLHMVDRPTVNITTTEDPVEYEIPGINQIAISPGIGLTFAACLRSILRQDPDIIMVGEIRDGETLDIAIKAALTGHLVLSSFHAMDAPGAITRLINMKAEPFLLTSCIVLVAAQRLLRRLCPACRQSYQPDAALCDRLKVEKTGLTFYRPTGCSACGQAGYSGRLGIIEILPFSPEVKELILTHASEAQLRKNMRETKNKTLWQCGVEKVLAGEVSVEELLRVVAEDEE